MLIGAPLDLETATLADLEALPGVGPRLALRLDAARACLRAGRASAVDRLGSIRGIGRKKAALLARFLGLDVGGGDDICSWGSWPTTSSGSDRPR